MKPTDYICIVDTESPHLHSVSVLWTCQRAHTPIPLQTHAFVTSDLQQQQHPLIPRHLQ